MNIFRNIIIALDFKTDEEQAKINRASAMAQAHEGTLITLLSVAPKAIADPEKTIVPVEKQQDLLIKKAQEKLDEIAKFFPQNEVTCLVKVGDPAVEIVKQALKGKHDLLLISTRKQKSLKENLLGSASIEIMRQCPCPVWAVKPGTGKEVKLMVGLHFDEKVEDHNNALNQELLQISAGLADKQTTEMHLVNVIDKPDAKLSQQRLSAIESLANESVNTPSYEIMSEVLEGNVTTMLPTYAKQQAVDLLIMGMLSRTGLRGFFIGNTAEKIIDDMPCSVLVVKPKEFKSQISI